jgi:flagellar hook-associated protein 2
MGFGVDGLVSGMNTGAMVDAMVSVYSLPQKALESDIVDTQKKKAAIASVIAKLDQLDEAIEDIEDEDDFKVYKAEYEETDAFKVTTENGAIPGNYTIQVNSLAESELELSEGFSDKSSTGVLGEGTLKVKYGSTTTEITVDSSTSSLSKVATLLDAVDGISAYVLDTGADSDPYRLVVQGEDTGEDNTIVLDATGLSGGTDLTFTEQRAAADAEIEINGITVNDSDNNFGTAIPGLDIEVYQTTSSAENVAVALDTDKIEENVNSIVSAYNTVVSYVNQMSVHNTELGISAPLVGETTVTRVLRKLASVVSGEYSSGDDINSLSLIGVKTESDGTLSLNSSDFQDALEDHLDDVVGLFTDSSGFGAEMRDIVDVYTDSVDGTLESYKDSLEDRIRSLEDDVTRYDYRIARYEERLRAQFSAMESMLGGMQGTSNYMAAYLGSSNKK